MAKFDRTILAVLALGLITLCGCQELTPHDTQSLLAPRLQRSEIIGFLAGLGTTFAAVPDLYHSPMTPTHEGDSRIG